MGKKKTSISQTSKVAAKAAKKAKAAQKTERKEKKKSGKAKDEFDDDQDLEAILENIRREWEAAHAVTEELVEGPPSRRANATLTTCPSGDYLWCIGGEFFSEDGKAYFYNDVFRYSPEKGQDPPTLSLLLLRAEGNSSSSVCCHLHIHSLRPTSSNPGGEFSSLYQNTFHHYRDFWCFDITTRSWDGLRQRFARQRAQDTGSFSRALVSSSFNKPLPRMALWKHYIILFGGFYDPGTITRYMNDLWIFDTQEYKWQQIEYRDPNERRPSPRSGFSFLSTPDGIILHGGYCKEYTKGKRPVGVMLDDTWLLRFSLTTASEVSASGKTKVDPLIIKWERRKRPSTAYAPALRSGATMALWAAKGMGVLFGGVTDEDSDEETLKSIFWNDLWKREKKGGKRKKDRTREDDDEDDEDDLKAAVAGPESEADPDDPLLSTPMPRYNAMLASRADFMTSYGGIFERGSREFTLDDFHALALDKMDRYVCLKKSDVVIPPEGDDVSSSSAEDDEDGDDSDEDEEASKPKVSLRDKATAFMGVSKDTKRSEEEMVSTPLPGETLAVFYARSRKFFFGNGRLEATANEKSSQKRIFVHLGEYWAQKARESSDNRGKLLRRDGFSLAEEHYGTYKPILEEVERILAEAGLDAEEMKRASATGQAGDGQSRNRR
ncbi:hypothetical protein BJV74DRAFT_887573 [Russula compacta]|nr:hypothetical protein BJV74DRAFT_887573 [Russula compacta]